MKNSDKNYIIVYIYMDDMLNLNNNDYIIQSTIKILTNKFDIKNLSVAYSF